MDTIYKKRVRGKFSKNFAGEKVLFDKNDTQELPYDKSVKFLIIKAKNFAKNQALMFKFGFGYFINNPIGFCHYLTDFSKDFNLHKIEVSPETYLRVYY